MLAFFANFTKNVMLSRSFGSYDFSLISKRPHRLTVRTRAFQAWNRGAIPREVTGTSEKQGRLAHLVERLIDVQ